MSVKPVPDGYHTITPFLLCKGVRELLEFLKTAFDAEIKEQHDAKDGTVMHAAARIGDSMLMLGEAQEKWPAMPSMLYLYVKDVDSFYKRAIEAGGKSLREPTNEFYGDRSCGILDASGNQWWIATHIEDVSPDEMRRREEAAGKR